MLVARQQGGRRRRTLNRRVVFTKLLDNTAELLHSGISAAGKQRKPRGDLHWVAAERALCDGWLLSAGPADLVVDLIGSSAQQQPAGHLTNK